MFVKYKIIFCGKYLRTAFVIRSSSGALRFGRYIIIFCISAGVVKTLFNASLKLMVRMLSETSGR